MRKKTKKNKKGAGRKPLFKDYPIKRKMYSMPKFPKQEKDKHEDVFGRIKEAIDTILEPYKFI